MKTTTRPCNPIDQVKILTSGANFGESLDRVDHGLLSLVFIQGPLAVHNLAFDIYKELYRVLGSGSLSLSYNGVKNLWTYTWDVKLPDRDYRVQYFIEDYEFEHHFHHPQYVSTLVQSIKSRMRGRLDADYNERQQAPRPPAG